MLYSIPYLIFLLIFKLLAQAVFSTSWILSNGFIHVSIQWSVENIDIFTSKLSSKSACCPTSRAKYGIKKSKIIFKGSCAYAQNLNQPIMCVMMILHVSEAQYVIKTSTLFYHGIQAKYLFIHFWNTDHNEWNENLFWHACALFNHEVTCLALPSHHISKVRICNVEIENQDNEGLLIPYCLHTFNPLPCSCYNTSED